MGGVFEALGASTRRRILVALAEGEQSTSTLVATLGAEAAISQPAVSQHLGVLRDARLVTVRAEGRQRLYALDPAGIDAAQAWLAGIAQALDPFAQPLDALATEVARGRRERRPDGTGERSAGDAGRRPA